MSRDTDVAPHDECTLILDQDGIDAFHRFLASWWERSQSLVPLEPDLEFAFTLVLGELIANVAGHAYADTPEHQRWLRVRFESLHSCVVGELRDGGKPFENATERLKSVAHEEEAMDQESGRGLRIVTQLADSIEYVRTESGENVWRIVKCAR